MGGHYQGLHLDLYYSGLYIPQLQHLIPDPWIAYDLRGRITKDQGSGDEAV
jgi:hypothetical protein